LKLALILHVVVVGTPVEHDVTAPVKDTVRPAGRAEVKLILSAPTRPGHPPSAVALIWASGEAAPNWNATVGVVVDTATQ